MATLELSLDLLPMDGPTVINPDAHKADKAAAAPSPKTAPILELVPDTGFAPSAKASSPGLELTPDAAFAPPAKPTATILQLTPDAAFAPPVAATKPAARPGMEVSFEGETAPAAPADPALQDKFYKEAHAQYVEGHIDQPLWDRALAQANNDKEQATPVYLKARATALRLLDREMRAKDRASIRADDQRHAQGVTLVRKPVIVEDFPEDLPMEPRFDKRRVAALVAIVAVLALGAVVYFGMQGRDTKAVVTAEAAAAAKAKAAEFEKAAAERTAALRAEREAAEKATFMAKVAELIETKNWNVLVLYANEWTRREPNNPAAWSQLSVGYNNLKQYNEAMQAAQQAVKLAPKDAAMWRTLGQVTMNANRLEEALVAFEGATTLDERDAESLVQASILQARMGNFADAARSIDKALLVVPADTEAQCLKAAIALRSRGPRGEAAAGKASGGESACMDIIDPPKPKVVENKIPAPSQNAPRPVRR
jgi:tetratricopeptide (TPR) repeat protein